MIGFTDLSREEELVQIWTECFGDTESFIREFLHKIAVKGKIVSYDIGGRIVCAAYLLPIAYRKQGSRDLPCWYLYAAGTLPEYQRNGYFSKLLSYIKEYISEPVFLVPASRSLVKYYEKCGYVIWQEEVTAEKIGIKGKCDGNQDEVSVADYTKARENCFIKQGYLAWDIYFMDYILSTHRKMGGSVKKIRIKECDYFCMYWLEEYGSEVIEFFSQEDVKNFTCPVVMTNQAHMKAHRGYFNLAME